MVVARSERRTSGCTELVRERALERTYLALVRGRPRSRTGRIEAAIGRDRDDPTRVSLDTDTPRDAVTHFEVERLWPDHALLRVRSRRAGCTRSASTSRRSTCPSSATTSTASPTARSTGSSCTRRGSRSPHPFTGERIDINSPLPPDLQAYLDALERRANADRRA